MDRIGVNQCKQLHDDYYELDSSGQGRIIFFSYHRFISFLIDRLELDCAQIVKIAFISNTLPVCGYILSIKPTM